MKKTNEMKLSEESINSVITEPTEGLAENIINRCIDRINQHCEWTSNNEWQKNFNLCDYIRECLNQAGCVFIEEFEGERTKQTPEDFIKATEQSRRVFIMEADKWTKSDKRKLMKEMLTINNIVDLELFYDMWHHSWTTSLIIKEFIKYKDNIKQIMAMHIKLREVGIVKYHNYFFPKTLNELCEVIQTNHDFEEFVRLWRENEHKYGYLWILKLYREQYLGYKVA